MHTNGFCFKIWVGKFQIIKPHLKMHINGFSFKRGRWGTLTMNLMFYFLKRHFVKGITFSVFSYENICTPSLNRCKNVTCHLEFPPSLSTKSQLIFHRIWNLNWRAEPFQTSSNLICHFTSVSSLVLWIKCNSFCKRHGSKLNWIARCKTDFCWWDGSIRI